MSSLEHMLGYVSILCNGDIDRTANKRSLLTWLEEWFFYFQFIWGRTLTRWVDAGAIYKAKGRKSTLRLVLHEKLKIVKQARLSWPRYVSFDKDHALTKQKWTDNVVGLASKHCGLVQQVIAITRSKQQYLKDRKHLHQLILCLMYFVLPTVHWLHDREA